MAGRSHTPTSGKITRGIKPNTFLDKTISFIEEKLPEWRDDKTRKHADAEEDLNGQLCKFLDDRARTDFPMASFHHEEKQGKRRRVDISVGPTSKAIEASLYDSIYEPFLVIEGKRIPAPATDREVEYVTGHDKKSGGIQRFRLGLHGPKFDVAVMVGYVQSGDAADWHKSLNRWITDLASSGKDKSCSWSTKDHLGKPANDGKGKAFRCSSKHGRSNGKADIQLIHLWICVLKPKKKSV